MSLSFWLFKPQDNELKAPLDFRLTLRVLKHTWKWALLSAKKYRIQQRGASVLYPEYASKFQEDGVIKHNISLANMSPIFMNFVSEGVDDLLKRKQEEIDRSGDKRTFESTLHSIPEKGLVAFEKSAFGSEVRNIVQDIVGTHAKLRNIQLHVNSPGETFQVFSQGNDTIPVTPHFGFHADNNINTIKAMVYLEIQNGDGAFQYLRGSQNFSSLICFALKKANRHLGLHLNTPNSLARMMSIPWFLRAKSEVSAFSSETRVARLIANTDCGIGAIAGDVVIFDPVGLHKGGLVKNHRRIALQLVYSEESSLWAI